MASWPATCWCIRMYVLRWLVISGRAQLCRVVNKEQKRTTTNDKKELALENWLLAKERREERGKQDWGRRYFYGVASNDWPTNDEHAAIPIVNSWAIQPYSSQSASHWNVIRLRSVGKHSTSKRCAFLCWSTSLPSLECERLTSTNEKPEQVYGCHHFRNGHAWILQYCCSDASCSCMLHVFTYYAHAGQ